MSPYTEDPAANAALMSGASEKANRLNILAAVAQMANNPGAAAATQMAAKNQQAQYAPQRLGVQGFALPDSGAFVPSPIYTNERKDEREAKRSALQATLEARAEADQRRIDAQKDRDADRGALMMTLASMRGAGGGRGAAGKPPSLGRTLPAGQVAKLGEQESGVSEFADIAGGFDDNYAGNYGMAGVQNFLGKNMPGSKYADQSNWWMNYNDKKNVIRNKLFGSALTAPEKKAFDDANVTEGMAPAQIKTKLAQQAAAAAKAHNKLIERFGGSGYNVSGFEPVAEPTAALPGGRPRTAAPASAGGLSAEEQAELDGLRARFKK